MGPNVAGVIGTAGAAGATPLSTFKLPATTAPK